MMLCRKCKLEIRDPLYQYLKVGERGIGTYYFIICPLCKSSNKISEDQHKYLMLLKKHGVPALPRRGGLDWFNCYFENLKYVPAIKSGQIDIWDEMEKEVISWMDTFSFNTVRKQQAFKDEITARIEKDPTLIYETALDYIKSEKRVFYHDGLLKVICIRCQQIIQDPGKHLRSAKKQYRYSVICPICNWTTNIKYRHYVEMKRQVDRYPDKTELYPRIRSRLKKKKKIRPKEGLDLERSLKRFICRKCRHPIKTPLLERKFVTTARRKGTNTWLICDHCHFPNAVPRAFLLELKRIELEKKLSGGHKVNGERRNRRSISTC